MMRSLFSGVSGIRAHQTRMDVIGNNIANVNTVAYKSQSMTFNEVFYQTTQTATGPNATTGRGGTNAKQIGLGSTVGAISVDPTAQGVISVLSIVVNVVVFAAIIKRSMKLKKNPYKDEIWKGTKDYEEAMSRAE